MIMMNPQSSEVHRIIGNGRKYSESDTAQTVPVGDPNPNVARLFYNRDDATVQHLEAHLESYLNVCLNDSCAPESESPRRHVTRGEHQLTPDSSSCASQSSSSLDNVSLADKDDDAPFAFAFADRASGVVFSSGLISASGDRITAQEFSQVGRGLAPTLRLVIPPFTTTKQQRASSEDPEEERESICPSASLPSFALTLASPITSPHSPIHPIPPPAKPFTRASYYAQVARARARLSGTRRIPYLPQYCAHTLRPFIPLTNCPLCAIQLLACETWYNSRNAHTHTQIRINTDTHAPPGPPPSSKIGRGSRRTTLRVPQVLPADCTPTTRAIFYALGLPLGKLDKSCVDWEVVDAIMFMPSCPPPRHGAGKNAAAAIRGSSSSRIHVLFRRACHFFSIPARVSVAVTPKLARR